MKAISVRLEPEQEERLKKLKQELHNSDAGVVRFALDLLWRTISEKQAIPTAIDETDPAHAAA